MVEDGTAVCQPSNECALSIRDIDKRFGATQALSQVSFDVRGGSIHALVGGNGSGKSSLIKALAGVQPADGGHFEIHGVSQDASAMSPALAARAGLHFVHQQSSTFPALTVAENLHLGRGFGGSALSPINWRSLRRRTQAVLERFEIAAHPDTRVGELNRATGAMLAIARALQDQEDASSAVLVLDEPTSSLPSSEVDLLLDALSRYAAQGQTILLVTHRLDEVSAVADRVTMLRDGRTFRTLDKSEINKTALVELLVGSAAETSAPLRRGTVSAGPVVLQTSNLSAGPLRSVDISLRAGEIVGVAGLLGSGRSSLLRTLFGLTAPPTGTFRVDGTDVRPGSVSSSMQAGIAYVPEDRAHESVFHDLAITENLSMTMVPSYWRSGFLRHGREARDARDLNRKYAVKAASERAPMSTLSGGNQQKVVLARWMRRRPRVLLLDEPTQGVDIAARQQIYRLIREAVDQGATALVASSEFAELEALCDRAIVIRGGVLAHEVAGDDLTEHVLERLAHMEVPA